MKTKLFITPFCFYLNSFFHAATLVMPTCQIGKPGMST